MRKGILGVLAAAAIAAFPGLAPAQTPGTDLSVLETPSDNGTMFQPCCPVCCPRGWISGEYLLWWTRNASDPTAFAAPGVVPPNIIVLPVDPPALLGGSNLHYNPSSGARFGAGYWFGDERRWGAEVIGFFLQNQAIHQSVSSDANGNPGLVQQVIDVNKGLDNLVISDPGFVAGSMSLASTSQLWGIEANGLFNLFRNNRWDVSLLAGFRFLDLHETLDITTSQVGFGNVPIIIPVFPPIIIPTGNSQLMFQGKTLPVGSTMTIVDSFHTRNDFYGGQLGARAYCNLGRWFVGGTLQVGLGDTVQSITIAGQTTATAPGLNPQSVPAGILATASNSGHFTHDAFSVVPQAEFRVGYQLTRRLGAFVGFDFLYWSNVVRPGTEVSNVVDERSIPSSPNFVPGFQAAVPPRPAFAQTGYWAQGLSFGLQFNW